MFIPHLHYEYQMPSTYSLFDSFAFAVSAHGNGILRDVNPLGSTAVFALVTTIFQQFVTKG